MEQQAILEILRDEGLIVRPPDRTGGGLKYIQLHFFYILNSLS